VLVYGVAWNYDEDIYLETTTYFLGPEPNTNIWSQYALLGGSGNTNENVVLAGWLPGAGMTVWNTTIPYQSGGFQPTQQWLSGTPNWSTASITWSDLGSGAAIEGNTIRLWTTPVPCAQGFNSFIM